MKVTYPIVIAKHNGLFRVSVRDVPEATAQDTDRRAAKAAAQERLREVLRERVKAHEDLPVPSTTRRREDMLAMPLLTTAKLALYQTMRDQNVSNVALGKRLGIAEGAVRRLVDPDHPSRIGAVEEALAELGKRLIVEMWRR